MKCSRIGMLLVLGLGPVWTVGAFCQTYVRIDLVECAIQGVCWFPLQVHPLSINEQGEIAGYYLGGARDIPTGFVRAAGAGTITSFSAPGAFAETFANSINDTGTITGYYAVPPFTFPNFTTHGFVRDPEGNITTFDPPGSVNT